jgi:AcrR family transcriptional regulator
MVGFSANLGWVEFLPPPSVLTVIPLAKPLASALSKDGPRLKREDWLQAAFNAIVEGGVENLKILLLAESLGVTRGSFYWHFADHAELLKATLAGWKEQEIQRLRRIEHQQTQDPLADMYTLLDAALAHSTDELENMRFELAVRGLGRRDAPVAALLVEVDQARNQLFVKHFSRLFQDPQKANDLAALFYLTIVGCFQALSRPGNPARSKDYFKSIMATFLIQAQLPAMGPGPGPGPAPEADSAG